MNKNENSGGGIINPDYRQEKRDILCTVSKQGFTSGRKYIIEMEDRYVCGIYNDSGVLRRIEKEFFYDNFRFFPSDELIIQ